MSIELNTRPVSPADLLDEDSPRLAALLEAIAEGSAERERDLVPPHEQIRLIKEARLGAIRVPTEYGGAGGSLRDLFRIVVAIGAADSNIGQIIRAHYAYVEQMLRSTNQAQREFWLREIANGTIIAGAATELGQYKVGAESVDTTLLPDENGDLRLNGTKYYSTGSLYADALVYTAFDPENRLAIVILPEDREGITLEDDWDGIGQRLTGTGTTRLDDVLVEPDDVLMVVPKDSPPFRYGVAQLVLTAIVAGIIRDAAKDAVGLVHSREGRPFEHAPAERPAEDPLLQEIVGEIVSAAYAAEATVLIAAEALDAEAESVIEGVADPEAAERASLAAAQAKVVIDGLAFQATTKLFDLGGASSIKHAKNLDRHWRNARTISTHNPRILKAQAVGDHALNGARLPGNWFF